VDLRLVPDLKFVILRTHVYEICKQLTIWPNKLLSHRIIYSLILSRFQEHRFHTQPYLSLHHCHWSKCSQLRCSYPQHQYSTDTNADTFNRTSITIKLEKYVDPVPTYCVAIRLQLYNPSHNLDLWSFQMKIGTGYSCPGARSHRFWVLYAPLFLS